MFDNKNFYNIAQQLAIIPFDFYRYEYARLVKIGIFQNSSLQCRDFQRKLDTCEKLSLGFLARTV